MRNSIRQIQTDHPRRGAAIVLIAFLLLIFLVGIAFSVDIARIQLAQVELQSTADLAARAGTEALARGVGANGNAATTDAAIRAEIEMVAELNRAGGSQVVISPTLDIEFGEAVKSPGGVPQFVGSTAQLSDSADAVRVTPKLPEFNLFFGGLSSGGSVNLSKRAAAVVQERDIVVVLDRSASMLDHDAGMIDISAYPAGLMALEDDLFGPTDRYHPDAGERASNIRHTEFEPIGNSGKLNLSRRQALQLAVYRFRKIVDQTRGSEQLGLVTYAEYADVPDDATTSGTPFDVDAGIPATIRSQMVGTGETRAYTSSPYRHEDERYASALESEADGYKNFDFNYLAMRWCEATNISDGVKKGEKVLFGTGRRPFAAPVMIVMTDGRHTKTESGLPEDAAALAVAAHPKLKIFTISFGQGADQDAMKRVALRGNGESHHADDFAGLVAIFEELARTAGTTLIE